MLTLPRTLLPLLMAIATLSSVSVIAQTAPATPAPPAAVTPTAPSVPATEVSGVKFDNTMDLRGSKLQLNGVGVRYKLVFKVYTAGL